MAGFWHYLRSHMPHNAIIVEAGANIGKDTMRMATMWPQARIHSFEPVPELFAVLREKTQICQNVSCYLYALGSYSGNSTFHVSRGKCTAISSLLTPLFSYKDTEFHTEKVSTITLAEWMNTRDIPHIDFLWLDVQGAEYSILKASPLHNIKLIQTEVNLVQRYASHPLYKEFDAWLCSQGFIRIAEDLYKGVWGNVLYEKK